LSSLLAAAAAGKTGYIRNTYKTSVHKPEGKEKINGKIRSR
jgi:hypothetical protein